MRPKELAAALRRHLRGLLEIHDTPRAIAGGIAIGVFIGFTPFLSVKTLLALGLATLLGCNRVAAAVAVTLHDVTLPISPFLVRLEYGIGYWFLSRPRHWPPQIHLHHFHPTEWLRWEVLEHLIWPMFLGSLVVGIPTALAAYFISLPMIERARRRRAQLTPG